MSARIVLGVPDAAAGAEALTLLAEDGDIEIVDTVTSAGDVIALLSTEDIDAVLLHEDLGPLPVLDLAREVAARFPDVGTVLLSRTQGPDVLRAALQSGVRGVVGLPLSLEDLHTTVVQAAGWARAVRDRLLRTDDDAGAGGTMVALAGAKGGVGTTTLAVHLALAAQLADRERSVCLVDLDLQAGDVRSLLDLSHRRSVVDLVEVADDLTARHLDDSLYPHASGLRVLLPPADGEFAEDVSGRVARQILGAIRSRFDIVVVDVGTVVTEAGAVATEMADRVLVVATPDVPALRAANRLVGLWERLQVRKDGVEVLVNRASRESEVQPELVAKVVSVRCVRAVVPADFRGLEPAANTGVPERLEDTPARRGIDALAAELGLVRSTRGGVRLRRGPRPVPAAPRGAAAPAAVGRLDLHAETGQTAIEAVGAITLLGLVVLGLFQLVLAGYTFVLAQHGSREGARAYAVGADAAEVEQVATADLRGQWRPDPDDPEHVVVRVDDDEDVVSLRLTVPTLVPVLPEPLRITVDSGTYVEGAVGARGLEGS